MVQNEFAKFPYYVYGVRRSTPCIFPINAMVDVLHTSEEIALISQSYRRSKSNNNNNNKNRLREVEKVISSCH